MVNFLRELYSLPPNEKPTNKMKCWLSRCRRAYSRMKADGLTVEDFYDQGNGRKRKKLGCHAGRSTKINLLSRSEGACHEMPGLGHGVVGMVR